MPEVNIKTLKGHSLYVKGAFVIKTKSGSFQEASS